jgi:toxin ParE1/3/4
MVRMGASGPRRELRLRRQQITHASRPPSIDGLVTGWVQMLQWLPRSGRPGRVVGTRELVITRAPYIVAYRIIGDTVGILRVLHCSWQWSDDMPY